MVDEVVPAVAIDIAHDDREVVLVLASTYLHIAEAGYCLSALAIVFTLYSLTIVGGFGAYYSGLFQICVPKIVVDVSALVLVPVRIQRHARALFLVPVATGDSLHDCSVLVHFSFINRKHSYIVHS